MQSLYAYGQSKRANLALALEAVKAQEEEESSDESSSKDNKKALEALAEGIEEIGENTPDLIAEAYQEYNQQNKKDHKYFKKKMLQEADQVYDHYLKILQLLKDLIRAEEAYVGSQEEKKEIQGQLVKMQRPLAENKVLSALSKNQRLEDQVIRRAISWDNEIKLLIKWYKDYIYNQEDFVSYRKKTERDFEHDTRLVLMIVKHILFKEEEIDSYFAEQIFNWTEDKSILKSMVLKTLKGIADGSGDFELAEISYNWEDDKAFFEKIFDTTTEKEQELDQYISKTSKNWEMDRLAVLDHIILRMALCELINFPSIPVKVTINEYIEISKLYSTPKSRQFINGVLDVLSKQLKDSGILKKSGRGLLDNK